MVAASVVFNVVHCAKTSDSDSVLCTELGSYTAIEQQNTRAFAFTIHQKNKGQYERERERDRRENEERQYSQNGLGLPFYFDSRWEVFGNKDVPDLEECAIC